jgi:replication factor A1
MYKDCGPSKPTQIYYVLPFICADVIGVVTMLLNVSSMQIRTRQNESLKRTVTICNARSVAHKCLYHVLLCIWLLKLQTMGDSGASLDVVLWGERAIAFPVE